MLSTRREPALPLAALRAHGELLELRADELRFTSEEAAGFLNGRLGLGLAPQDIDVLVERTEGWPTGLSGPWRRSNGWASWDAGPTAGRLQFGVRRA